MVIVDGLKQRKSVSLLAHALMILTTEERIEQTSWFLSRSKIVYLKA